MKLSHGFVELSTYICQYSISKGRVMKPHKLNVGQRQQAEIERLSRLSRAEFDAINRRQDAKDNFSKAALDRIKKAVVNPELYGGLRPIYSLSHGSQETMRPDRRKLKTAMQSILKQPGPVVVFGGFTGIFAEHIASVIRRKIIFSDILEEWAKEWKSRRGKRSAVVADSGKPSVGINAPFNPKKVGLFVSFEPMIEPFYEQINEFADSRNGLLLAYRNRARYNSLLNSLSQNKSLSVKVIQVGAELPQDDVKLNDILMRTTLVHIRKKASI